MPVSKKPKKKTRSHKSSRKHNSFKPRLFYIIWVLLGLILVGYWFQSHLASRYSFEAIPPAAVEIAETPTYSPSRLRIPKIELDKPVAEAEIKNGIWQINNQAISHLVTSANPGQSGNIVLYGHNTKQWLGKLKQVNLDDLITLMDASGRIHQYQIFNKVTVKPSQIELVMPTSEEILTIYTCTGFADSLRLVIQAKPASP
jgi:LPXTG-site transpeptidase (sortase) family protein